MNKKKISSKIVKYTIAIVILCFAATTAHLIFIINRYNTQSLTVSVTLNCIIHIGALVAAVAFASYAADSIHALSKEHDKSKSASEKEEQAKFNDKIISGDFYSPKSADIDAANAKLNDFLADFISELNNANQKKTNSGQYKGQYKETLEKLNETYTALEQSSKYISDITAALNNESASSLTADNPVLPQIKQLLNTINTADTLLGNLAQMNVNINSFRIEANEKISRSAISIGEKYNHSFSVLKNNLSSIKYNSSNTMRDVQISSKLHQEQADALDQIKANAEVMERQLKNLQVTVFEGSKSALRGRSLPNNTASPEQIKYIEKVSAASGDMAVVIKNLNQLNSQLNKLTSSNSVSKESALQIAANFDEITKSTRTALDALDKFNFKDTIPFVESKRNSTERLRPANSMQTAANTAGNTAPVKPRSATLSKPAEGIQELRVRPNTPPIIARPILKNIKSDHNFESKDYGKYSRK